MRERECHWEQKWKHGVVCCDSICVQVNICITYVHTYIRTSARWQRIVKCEKLFWLCWSRVYPHILATEQVFTAQLRSSQKPVYQIQSLCYCCRFDRVIVLIISTTFGHIRVLFTAQIHFNNFSAVRKNNKYGRWQWRFTTTWNLYLLYKQIGCRCRLVMQYFLLTVLPCCVLIAGNSLSYLCCLCLHYEFNWSYAINFFVLFVPS